MVGVRYVDGFGTMWWFWYLGEVVAGRADLVHTNLLFFPGGKDVFAHTGGNLLDGLAAWPLRAVLGPVLGYNAWIAVLVATNFAAGAYLGRVMTRSPGWPAGLVLALNPFVLREIEEGRPTQAWLALPALALAGTWQARGVSGAVATGLAVAATGWLYWYYGFVFGILVVFAGVVRLGHRRDFNSAWTLGLAGLVALAAVSPALALLSGQLAEGKVPGLFAMDGTCVTAPLAFRTLEGDAAGMQVLSLRGVFGAVVDEGGVRFTPGEPALGLAGVAAAALGGVVLWRSHQRAAALVALLAVTLSLGIALGPVLVLGDGFVVNRPYIWLMQEIDVLRRWWWPGRGVAGVVVALCVLVPAAARSRLGMLGVVTMVAVETWRVGIVPLSTWDGAVAPGMRCLAGAPHGAVVDLPFLSDQHNLYLQTLHQKPILGGMLVKKPSFGSASALALRAENSFLDLLLDYGDMEMLRDPAYDEADRQRLLALGFRYAVVDLSRFEGTAAGLGAGTMGGSNWPRVKRLLRPVIGEPQVEGVGVAVYTLDGSTLSCSD